MDEIDAIVEDVISKLQYADYLTKPMMGQDFHLQNRISYGRRD